MRIFISTGEVSGDLQAAMLIESLFKLRFETKLVFYPMGRLFLYLLNKVHCTFKKKVVVKENESSID